MAVYQVHFIFSSYYRDGPVYLYGDFTSPPWQPIEMHASSEDHDLDPLEGHPSVRNFKCIVEVREGHWQYKYRVGENKWVIDEHARKVTNKDGTVNNVLVVKSDEQAKTNEPSMLASEVSSTKSTSWELVNKKSQKKGDDSQEKGTQPLTTPSDDSIPTRKKSCNEVSSPLQRPISVEGQRPPAVDTVLVTNETPIGPSGSLDRSYGSRQSSTQNSYAGEPMQRGTAPDIERISYIMAMPSKDCANETPNIMAYQDARILELSPDYQTATPLPTDFESGGLDRTTSITTNPTGESRYFGERISWASSTHHSMEKDLADVSNDASEPPEDPCASQTVPEASLAHSATQDNCTQSTIPSASELPVDPRAPQVSTEASSTDRSTDENPSDASDGAAEPFGNTLDSQLSEELTEEEATNSEEETFGLLPKGQQTAEQEPSSSDHPPLTLICLGRRFYRTGCLSESALPDRELDLSSTTDSSSDALSVTDSPEYTNNAKEPSNIRSYAPIVRRSHSVPGHRSNIIAVRCFNKRPRAKLPLPMEQNCEDAYVGSYRTIGKSEEQGQDEQPYLGTVSRISLWLRRRFCF